MEADEPCAEECLGRLARAAHVEPEHVAVAAHARKRLPQPQLLELARPQLHETVGDLGALIARIDRAFGALHEEADPHRLRPGVVVLHGELQVDRVLHHGAELVDLERRRLGVEDDLRLRRVPHVRIEAVEEGAVAADAADEPGPQHRAVGGRGGDRRLAGGVVAVHERREGDRELDRPLLAVELRADHGVALPLEVGACLLRPIPVGKGVDRVDVPAEEAEPEALGEVVVGPQLKFQLVVPEDAIERMVEHVGEPAAGLEPGVHRVDRGREGEVEVFLVVGPVDLHLRLRRRHEAEVGLRVVVPEGREGRGVVPLPFLHDAVDRGRGLHHRHPEDRRIDLGRRSVGGGRLGGLEPGRQEARCDARRREPEQRQRQHAGKEPRSEPLPAGSCGGGQTSGVHAHPSLKGGDIQLLFGC